MFSSATQTPWTPDFWFIFIFGGVAFALVYGIYTLVGQLKERRWGRALVVVCAMTGFCGAIVTVVSKMI